MSPIWLGVFSIEWEEDVFLALLLLPSGSTESLTSFTPVLNGDDAFSFFLFFFLPFAPEYGLYEERSVVLSPSKDLLEFTDISPSSETGANIRFIVEIGERILLDDDDDDGPL